MPGDTSCDAGEVSDSSRERPTGALQDAAEIESDLRRLVDAWPTLPEILRSGILALVESARRIM